MPLLLTNARHILRLGFSKDMGTIASLSSRRLRAFHSTAPRLTRNQIYDPIRNPDTLTTYISLSSSSRTPLLTLWTTSYCPTCANVLPLVQSLVEVGIGESQGGVAFAPVELDSPDMMGSSSSSPFSESVAMTYMITAIPTLLSFDAGEPQTRTRVVDARNLLDRDFLVDWIRDEARRQGQRGGGGGGLVSVFGGLFGGGKG
ncbi:hypothetical protein E4U21_007736 [Claviceps maximensis]|nr:hypothetical protein E4U21_007736 [Claviceps maximensis]